jgi:hypothetical protein
MSPRRQGNRQEFDSVPPIPPPSSGEDDFLKAFLQLEPKGEEPAGSGEPYLLSIDQIFPDPVQPRRSMPDDLRARWIAGERVSGLLDEWQGRVSLAIRKAGLPALVGLPRNYINDYQEDTPLDEVSEKTAQLPPGIAPWIELLRLAASINQAGLEQPVTAYASSEKQYVLIVGERRLLAFHVLQWIGYAGHDQIPALKRERYNIWSQAFENGARQNLNAISKARQLALLLMEMNDVWQPLEDGTQPDQAWYAQTADLRVPYGKAEAVATVLGLSGPVAIRQYRRFLRLPEEVWNLADTHNWAADKIHRILRDAGEDSYRSVRIARIEAGLEPPDSPEPPPADKRARQWISQVVGGKRPVIEQITDEERRVALQVIEQARVALNEWEHDLRNG